MKKLFAWLADNAGDCLLAIGLGLAGYGVCAVYGHGWACIGLGASLAFIAYAGQATDLICSILAARGQKK